MTKKPKPKRETLEMLDGRVYFSDDHWVTVWLNRGNAPSHRMVTSKKVADNIRYLATVAFAGGRNENTTWLNGDDEERMK